MASTHLKDFAWDHAAGDDAIGDAGVGHSSRDELTRGFRGHQQRPPHLSVLRSHSRLCTPACCPPSGSTRPPWPAASCTRCRRSSAGDRRSPALSSPPAWAGCPADRPRTWSRISCLCGDTRGLGALHVIQIFEATPLAFLLTWRSPPCSRRCLPCWSTCPPAAPDSRCISDTCCASGGPAPWEWSGLRCAGCSLRTPGSLQDTREGKQNYSRSKEQTGAGAGAG